MNISRNYGLDFEHLIDKSNDYYKSEKIAFINKKPTPIKILSVSGNKISDAIFEKKSTTDYNGIYNGYHIDFEAKSTVKSTFNIASNIHEHQLEHMQNIFEAGGITFIIIFFKTENRIFLIPFENLINIVKSSVNVNECENLGFELKESLNPSIDYISIVDKLIEEKYGK